MIKKVNKYIAPEIYANISLNTRIISIIGECLPENLSAHTECIGSEGKTLRLAADSAALGSQLRFYVDAMLTALNNAGMTQYKRIKIVTNQFANPMRLAQSHSPGRKPPELSEQTTQLIRSTAKTIDDDRLKQAMERLAEIGENNKQKY